MITGRTIRETAIIYFITECKRVTLQAYAKSMGLSQQGTKLELAIRIFDNTNQHTYQIHLPPSGTISIGIGMSVHQGEKNGQASKQQKNITKNASTF